MNASTCDLNRATLQLEDRLSLKWLSQQEWTVSAPAMHGYSYRQSWEFGKACARRMGATSEHVGMFRGEECVAVADVRIRTLPFVGGGIAYISGGPLLCAGMWNIAEGTLFRTLETLVDEYVQTRGLVLRIAPPIEWAADGWNVEPVFDQLGFGSHNGLRRYRTIMIDLTPGLEQVRKNLHQKWRNCLNRAEKNSMTVKVGKSVDLLDRFCALHQELIDRKGFEVDLSAEYYRDLQRQIDVPEKYQIKLAEIDGNDVAGHVGSILGETSVYLLGASTHVGNDLKASYLLQWETIVEASRQGCRWYDLGGIDPDGNAGVYHFKQRMSGVDITAHGPYELRPSNLRSRITGWAERAYRRLRKYKNRKCNP